MRRIAASSKLSLQVDALEQYRPAEATKAALRQAHEDAARITLQASRDKSHMPLPMFVTHAPAYSPLSIHTSVFTPLQAVLASDKELIDLDKGEASDKGHAACTHRFFTYPNGVVCSHRLHAR